MSDDLLDRLNPEQRDAVVTLEGPLLVLAGAGSGKTGVLTRRIAHMLRSGIDAEHIFAVTFTNKAAQEMKHRVIELVGEAGAKLWISTFHSSCARILRQEIEVLGWTKQFAIYDDDDQLRMIKEIIGVLGYDPERVIAKDLLSMIDHHKNRTAGSARELMDQRRSHHHDPLVRVWQEYDERLKAADAVDFNDLIRLVVKLFREHPDVLEKWQDQFHYLMVDEYQDTNKGQYELLTFLAKKRRHIAVVGDDDQSIYGFRGADITNILRFQDDYPDCKVIRLEQNYRCTKNILAVANHVVAINTGRMAKKLWTAGEVGNKVTLIACDSGKDEAARVARGLVKLRMQGHTYADMAIIYRTNATSRAFEAALREHGVPHKIVGGRKFYEHREIRDMLGYLRLIVNPADDAAVLRVINVPTRGIGPKTLSGLRDDAVSRGEPLLKAARGRMGSKDAGSIAISSFVSLIDDLTDAAKTLTTAELVVMLLVRTGYRTGLEAANTPEDRTRLENLNEFIRDAAEFDPPPEFQTPMEQLRAWLDRISLAGQDEEIPDGGEVTLMTVHNAKGLEYPVVYVVQMMEGQFPHRRSLDQSADVEEERRLAYVAFTRAKKRLIITRSRTTTPLPGENRGPNVPKLVAASRFLFALPSEACEGDLPTGRPTETEEDGPPRLDDDLEPKLRALARQQKHKLSPDIGALTLVDIAYAGELTRGIRVYHPEFGVGSVKSTGLNSVKVDFSGKNHTISFNDEQLKRVRD